MLRSAVRPLFLLFLALLALGGNGLARAAAVFPDALSSALADRLMRVPEFRLIREEAEKLGVHAYLFGGTAAGYAHYVKWDLEREAGDQRFLPSRFDYHYWNIYRSTQDLDVVVDGTPADADRLQRVLEEKYPHIQGSKSAWELRLLREDRGDKQALLRNPEFLNQHTDSNSTGLVEITHPEGHAPVVRDLRDWDAAEPHFLRDVAEGKLHYYFSPTHGATKFAQEGRNPPILSVIRYLTKAFQYELELRPEDLAAVKKIIDDFQPNGPDLANNYVRHWLVEKDNAKKLYLNAVDLEYASRTLDELGLKAKLIAVAKDANKKGTLAWWLSREPLASKPVGEGQGPTAAQLGLDVVAHETSDYLAFESITRSPRGEPNVFISRPNQVGETAIHGPGFYVREGSQGARGTGLTIRFQLLPEAREGSDFVRTPKGDHYLRILNKSALRVIPESLNWSKLDYLRYLAEGKKISPDDRGIFEKLKLRLSTQLVSPEDYGKMQELAEAKLAAGEDLPAFYRAWLEEEHPPAELPRLWKSLAPRISLLAQKNEAYPASTVLAPLLRQAASLGDADRAALAAAVAATSTEHPSTAASLLALKTAEPVAREGILRSALESEKLLLSQVTPEVREALRESHDPVGLVKLLIARTPGRAWPSVVYGAVKEAGLESPFVRAVEGELRGAVAARITDPAHAGLVGYDDEPLLAAHFNSALATPAEAESFLAHRTRTENTLNVFDQLFFGNPHLREAEAVRDRLAGLAVKGIRFLGDPSRRAISQALELWYQTYGRGTARVDDALDSFLVNAFRPGTLGVSVVPVMLDRDLAYFLERHGNVLTPNVLETFFRNVSTTEFSSTRYRILQLLEKDPALLTPPVKEGILTYLRRVVRDRSLYSIGEAKAFNRMVRMVGPAVPPKLLAEWKAAVMAIAQAPAAPTTRSELLRAWFHGPAAVADEAFTRQILDTAPLRLLGESLYPEATREASPYVESFLRRAIAQPYKSGREGDWIYTFDASVEYAGRNWTTPELEQFLDWRLDAISRMQTRGQLAFYLKNWPTSSPRSLDRLNYLLDRAGEYAAADDILLAGIRIVSESGVPPTDPRAQDAVVRMLKRYESNRWPEVRRGLRTLLDRPEWSALPQAKRYRGVLDEHRSATGLTLNTFSTTSPYVKPASPVERRVQAVQDPFVDCTNAFLKLWGF